MSTASAARALDEALEAKRDQLLAYLARLQSVAVAFSGGVDSAVVAAAAWRSLPGRAVAVIGHSASLAEGELAAARRTAESIGIPLQVIETREFERPDYTRNANDRCFHCKTELYSRMHQLRSTWGSSALVNGANADDLHDYRPGLRAAADHSVCSPLAECGISKVEVRQLAAHWGLDVWDKPAAPCLSSRVAYGLPVTPERLAMVDAAERYLRQRGFQTVRVRYHAEALARLEVGADEVSRLADGSLRGEISRRLRELGFHFITLDLEGFRSGSLNTLVPLTTRHGS